MKFTLNKNTKTPRNIIGSKCEIKKTLIIHVVTHLELEQALKDFLDLKIYRALIKLLDQTKRKTRA